MSALLARAHVGAGDAHLEHEAPIVDARSKRMEFVRRQPARAVDDVEQDGLELVEQETSAGDAVASRRLPIEAVGVEQVAGPRLLGGDVDVPLASALTSSTSPRSVRSR